MKINNITSKYTTPSFTASVAGNRKGGNSNVSKNIFSYPQTSVKNTLNEFSNSRGNVLADIDLSDIYIQNPKKHDIRNIQFLADKDLCDAYELPKKEIKHNLQLPFEGAYPQYLIDQDAVEQYEATSNGIKDIANSTYCSFSGLEKLEQTEEKIIHKFAKVIKEILPF